MDKIVFRVWDIANECWSDELHCITEDGKLWHFPADGGGAIEDDPELYIAEKAIGLRDKNGVEIFEGDVVNLFELEFVVKWSKTDFAYIFSREGMFYWASPGKSLECEVIGNVHEKEKL